MQQLAPVEQLGQPSSTHIVGVAGHYPSQSRDQGYSGFWTSLQVRSCARNARGPSASGTHAAYQQLQLSRGDSEEVAQGMLAGHGDALQTSSSAGPMMCLVCVQGGANLPTSVPHGRWDLEHYYAPEARGDLTMYARHAAFVDGLDQFDASLFRCAGSAEPRGAAAVRSAIHCSAVALPLLAEQAAEARPCMRSL